MMSVVEGDGVASGVLLKNERATRCATIKTFDTYENRCDETGPRGRRFEARLTMRGFGAVASYGPFEDTPCGECSDNGDGTVSVAFDVLVPGT